MHVVVVSKSALTGNLLAEKFREHVVDAQYARELSSAETGIKVGEAIVVWDLSSSPQSSDLVRLSESAERTPVLVLGSGFSPILQADFLLNGARGYVDHQESFPALLSAVRRVARGGMRFSDEAYSAGVGRLRQRSRRPSSETRSSLTERERELLLYLVEGASSKEIADRMHISISTVKTHLQNIYGKLGVNNRMTLVLGLSSGGALQLSATDSMLTALQAHRRRPRGHPA